MNWRNYVLEYTPENEVMLNKFRAGCGATIPVTLIENDPTVEWIKFVTEADFVGIDRQHGAYCIAWWTGQWVVWNHVYPKELLRQTSLEVIIQILGLLRMDARAELKRRALL